MNTTNTCNMYMKRSADTVVNVAMVEFRFGAVVLIEKFVFSVAYKKISVAGSHFGTQLAMPLICLK